MTSPKGLSEVRNDLFDRTQGLNRGRSRRVEALWYLCKVVFLPPIPWPSSLRRLLLVKFGASIGRDLNIREGVNIHFPWKLLSPIFENPQTRSAKLPRLTSPGRAAQA